MTTLKELSNLRGRHALITGAAGRLGQIFAETLAELGADLILVDLPKSNLEGLAKRLENDWGTSLKFIPCDLEKQSHRLRLAEQVTNSNYNLSILVNNAAFVGSSQLLGWNVPFQNQSVESWHRALEVNLIAVFELCQVLYPTMKRAQGANIINITSIYGSYGPDWRLYEGTEINNPAAYAASKGGLTQLTRWLSTTMAPSVRVNAISPGGLFNHQDDSFVTKYESRTPLGRMAVQDDFKGAMAFLASDQSRYVTGHVLEVNGGWGVW